MHRNQYFTGILTVIFKPNHDFLLCSWLNDSEQTHRLGPGGGRGAGAGAGAGQDQQDNILLNYGPMLSVSPGYFSCFLNSLKNRIIIPKRVFYKSNNNNINTEKSVYWTSAFKMNNSI